MRPESSIRSSQPLAHIPLLLVLVLISTTTRPRWPGEDYHSLHFFLRCLLFLFIKTMGLFKHIRARSRGTQQSSAPEAKIYSTSDSLRAYLGTTPPLTPSTLRRIFVFVCPHSQDESYATSEDSVVGDTCMLCDMRDLAHCALVNRAWFQAAEGLL